MPCDAIGPIFRVCPCLQVPHGQLRRQRRQPAAEQTREEDRGPGRRLYTKKKQKKDRGLPEDVEVLSVARQYDAQVMLSALPHTISLVHGTEKELRLRRIRDGPPRSDERHEGQPRTTSDRQAVLQCQRHRQPRARG